MNEQIPQAPINNNLVWAILATVLCCLPTGVYAIICASKVNGLVMAGMVEEAKAKAAAAKKWSIISAIAWAVVMLIYVIFFVVLATSMN